MACATCNSFKPPPLPALIWRKELSLSDFVRSAGRCHCCSVILEGCRGCLAQHGLSEKSVKSVALCMAYQRGVEERPFDKDITLKMTDETEFCVEWFTLADEDCPCPESWDDMPVSERISPDTGSDEAFQKALRWIEDCDEEGEHEFCHRPKDRTMFPKRLVDVGLTTKIIKLVEMDRPVDRYIALSHRWGLVQIITTTAATYHAHLQRIPESALSNTFRQAVELTRRLGIPYIWIDSLCILQDSEADWRTESAKMAGIYASAHLTLAATASASGAGGFFRPTPDVAVAGRTPGGGEAYRLWFRPKVEHLLADDWRAHKTFPLLSRAWIYQERLLSPRVLHFGPHELYWECASTATCECGALDADDVAEPFAKLFYADVLAYGADEGYPTPMLWRSLVMHYTSLALTKSSDRVVAAGGVARQVAAVRRERYLAGLWEGSLVEDLLWEPQGCTRVGNGVPSWSWASVEGSVYYADAPLFWSVDGPAGQERAFTAQVVVKQCRCELVGPDLFGEVRGGKLVLVGVCREGVLRLGKGRFCDVLLDDGIALPVKLDSPVDQGTPGPFQDRELVICIRIGTAKVASHDPVQYSLVARRSQHPANADTYKRIGFLRYELKKQDPYAKGKQRIVTLI